MVDFQKDVIEKSFTAPVLVDFWAPWCGPCRVLTPILEKIAEEQADKWSLIKINTEEEEDLALQYHISSIPNVKMFYRGEVHQEFSGSLSRQMILDWLQKVLPGSGLIALDRFLDSNNNPTPIDLESLLSVHPDSNEIAFVLSQIYLWDDPARSLELLSGIKMGSPFYQQAIHIRDIGHFLTSTFEEPNLEEIKHQLLQSEIETAIKRSISLLSKNKNAGDGLLQKVVIGIFNLLGSKHALTIKYRKQFDMALWS